MVLDEGNGLLGSPVIPEGLNIDRCLNNPKTGAIRTLVLSLAMGNAADAVEIMCVGFIMSEMDNISSYQKSFLSAAVFMGMLFGGVLCGYLSDIIGRRPCLLYSLGVNTIAGLASAAAPNVNVLIACRVFAGLGIGGSVPIVFSMGAEMFPADKRGQYLSIIASFWMVGAIFVAFSAWIMLGDNFYGNKIMVGVGWRPFAVVSALPAISAMLLTYYKIPESPRFLVFKKRYSEAAVVINKLSSVQIDASDLMRSEQQERDIATEVLSHNDENGVCVDFDNENPRRSGSASYQPINTSGGAGNILQNSTMQRHSVDSKVSHSESLLATSTIALLFQGNLFWTSLTLLVIWFTLSFGSYGMSTWISTLFEDVGIGNPYAAAFIFAMANLPGNIISLLYIEVYGRRWLLSVGMCLAGGSALGFAFDTTMPVVVVLCASLFNAFSVIGWNSLDCLSGIFAPNKYHFEIIVRRLLYLDTHTNCSVVFLSTKVECFPTHVRTSAMGVLAAGGRLGAISAQFVNGSLEKNIPLLLFVTSACTIIGGLSAWMLPYDTVGRSLSEDAKHSGAVSSFGDNLLDDNVDVPQRLSLHSADRVSNVVFTPMVNSSQQ